MDVSWSRHGGQDCIRVRGLPPGVGLQVRPAAAAGVAGVPPTAGRLIADGVDMCFVPRFVAGTTYAVTIDDRTVEHLTIDHLDAVTTNTEAPAAVATDEGSETARLVRERPQRAATTEVLAIYPSSDVVPSNLLRLYIWFSAPMGEGYAADHVRLTDNAGEPIVGALLSTVDELWDHDRRRLTVLLDPARIKRGLTPHRQLGYPLRSGAAVRLVVDDQFRDAHGGGLRSPARQTYRVGDDERRHVEPQAWTVIPPSLHTVEPLEIGFDRLLDHGLLTRCLRVIGPDGRRVIGTSEVGPGERSWRLVPRRDWLPGAHRLLVDPRLEDPAGNSVIRLFDRDITRAVDGSRPRDPVAVTFSPT